MRAADALHYLEQTVYPGASACCSPAGVLLALAPALHLRCALSCRLMVAGAAVEASIQQGMSALSQQVALAHSFNLLLWVLMACNMLDEDEVGAVLYLVIVSMGSCPCRPHLDERLCGHGPHATVSVLDTLASYWQC